MLTARRELPCSRPRLSGSGTSNESPPGEPDAG
jgi:hypothetical protein